MILIADSGSTKTTWCILDRGKKKSLTTGGLNPFYNTSEDIYRELIKHLKPIVNDGVELVFFYGAGVVNSESGNIVRKAIAKLFPEAEIEPNSDLLAAARATLGLKQGIACILGTGSNSCLYDGKTITAHVPPLGYILGDEGSGAVLGKKLAGDFLKNLMPPHLASLFQNKFHFEYAEYLNNVYKNEKPNKFLAEFVPFLKENIEEPYCLRLLNDSFEEFIERNITQYPGFQELPVCFVGSVAFYFEEQIKEVLKKRNLRFGLILKEPMDGLVDYHIKNQKQL